MSKKSTKEKLDELLGIKPGESIDEFLDTLTVDSEQVSESMSAIKESVKENIENIDNSIQQYNENPELSGALAMHDMTSSLKNVEDLVNISNKIYRHIYNNIIASDLLDSELIGAAAKMLESIHINIAEFLSLYKERQRYADKIQLMILQQNQKKELMQLKHQLDLEKLKSKIDVGAVDVDSTSYSQEQIVKMLNEDNFESDL